jgi:hypothetical protein
MTYNALPATITAGWCFLSLGRPALTVIPTRHVEQTVFTTTEPNRCQEYDSVSALRLSSLPSRIVNQDFDWSRNPFPEDG